MLKPLILALGGYKAVAEALTKMAGQKCSVGGVYQWPYEGTIPHQWRPYVVELAKQRGVTVTPELASLAKLGDFTAVPDAQPKRKAASQ